MADLHNVRHLIEDIIVPIEQVVEIKEGKKTQAERYFFPGYVLIKMEMNEETWHLIRKVPKVIGFVGGKKGAPQPISEAEVEQIVSRMSDATKTPVQKIQYYEGEVVRILEGPFKDYSGLIAEVNYEKSKIKVEVEIFGRKTPVELDFDQVDKNS